MPTITSHPVCLGLIADIIANPADFAPRLILADWLEEFGDDADREQAAFIRRPLAGRGGYRTKRRKDDAARVREAIGGLLPKAWRVVLMADDDLATARLTDVLESGSWSILPRRLVAVIRHGFVSEVGCTADQWLAIGPKLVRCQPVADVRLSDPFPDDFVAGGTFGEARKVRTWKRKITSTAAVDALDARLFDLLRSGEVVERLRGRRCYRNPDGAWCAYADASRACVDWARTEAGLPPLATSPLTGPPRNDADDGDE